LEKYKKASFYCLIAFLVISVPGCFAELSSIQTHREFYMGGKIFLHLWLVWLCFLIRKDAFKISNNLQVGSMMMLYTIHGQFFSPWYMFVYHELIIAFSFLFPLPKKIFNVFVVVASAAYLSVMIWKFDNIYIWLNADSVVEWMIAGFAITVVAILSHSFFTTDRNHREALIRKFGLVGLQTASVVHDVKSMLASPRMNIDLIKKKLSTTTGFSNDGVQTLLATVESQLAGISVAMNGLNQVVALQQEEKQHLQLRLLIQNVSFTLNLSSRNIDLQISGDLEVFSEKPLIKSILFNILMNSVQAFRKNRQTSPKIFIRCLPEGGSYSQVEISDNAGGYPPEILKSLKMDESNRVNGSGMGLFLIATGMQSIQGHAVFSNTDEGAMVRLSFPNQNLRKCFRFLP
jgi:signal transduction histidine kinase